MTVKRIQDLPEAATVGAGDFVLVSQAGVTRKVGVSLLSGAIAGTALSGMTDVNLTGATAGGLLTFDGTRWVPTNNTTNQTYDGGNF